MDGKCAVLARALLFAELYDHRCIFCGWSCLQSPKLISYGGTWRYKICQWGMLEIPESLLIPVRCENNCWNSRAWSSASYSKEKESYEESSAYLFALDLVMKEISSSGALADCLLRLKDKPLSFLTAEEKTRETIATTVSELVRRLWLAYYTPYGDTWTMTCGGDKWQLTGPSSFDAANYLNFIIGFCWLRCMENNAPDPGRSLLYALQSSETLARFGVMSPKLRRCCGLVDDLLISVLSGYAAAIKTNKRYKISIRYWRIVLWSWETRKLHVEVMATLSFPGPEGTVFIGSSFDKKSVEVLDFDSIARSPAFVEFKERDPAEP